MLKSLFNRIQEVAIPEVKEIDGHSYMLDRETGYTQIKPDLEYPDTLNLSSLDALVKMIRFESKPTPDAPLFINIPGVDTVLAFLSPEPGLRFNRVFCFTVKATDVPGFRDGFRDHDKAIIELQTMFEQNEGTAYLLDLLSKISTDSNVITTDNGVSQKVEAMTGVNLKSRTPVKPRVKLRPFRTFQEVEQPESEFLLRLDDQGRVGLFEADGYMWRLQARQTIKAFLEEQLAEEIEAGTVVIAL